MGITLRNVTGSALTYNQMDENFRFLSQSYFYLSGSNIASGSLTLTGSLNTNGSTTMTGSLSISGSSVVLNTSAFTVADDLSGDPVFVVSSTQIGLLGTSSLNGVTRVTGSLNISGSATIIGNTRATGSVNISGSTTMTGSLDISGSLLIPSNINSTNRLLSSADNQKSINWGERTLFDNNSIAAINWLDRTLIDTTENTSIDWEARTLLDLNGNTILIWDDINSATFYGTSSVATSSLTASSVTPLNQNVIITGSLIVSGSNTFTNIGSAIFTGSMATTGSNTLIGNTVLSGSISVSGSQIFVGNQILTGSFLVSGSTTQIGNNSLTGNTSLSGSIVISGSTTNIIIGNTTITGSLTVSGSTTFKDTIFVVTGSQFYTGSSTYIGNQTITGSLSLTSNGMGTGLFINGQKQFNYLSAYHTASILPTQNVSGSFIYSTLVTSSGIAVNNNSQITFANTGIYNIQFSAQIFTQTGANVYIWFKRNGTNITNSATRIGPTSNNEYVVAAWNFVDTFTSGSYLEIAYQSDQTNTQFQYAAATGNIPAIPAIIATVTQIA